MQEFSLIPYKLGINSIWGMLSRVGSNFDHKSDTFLQTFNPSLYMFDKLNTNLILEFEKELNFCHIMNPPTLPFVDFTNKDDLLYIVLYENKYSQVTPLPPYLSPSLILLYTKLVFPDVDIPCLLLCFYISFVSVTFYTDVYNIINFYKDFYSSDNCSRLGSNASISIQSENLSEDFRNRINTFIDSLVNFYALMNFYLDHDYSEYFHERWFLKKAYIYDAYPYGSFLVFHGLIFHSFPDEDILSKLPVYIIKKLEDLNLLEHINNILISNRIFTEGLLYQTIVAVLDQLNSLEAPFTMLTGVFLSKGFFISYNPYLNTVDSWKNIAYMLTIGR